MPAVAMISLTVVSTDSGSTRYDDGVFVSPS
jgi:hypothetical protein